MSIFLSTDATFAIDISETKDERGRRVYDVVEGGPYVLRTMTGRQAARMEQAGDKADTCYDLLPALVVSGLDRMQIERLDPVAAMIMVHEAYRRSHVDEADRGK